MPRVLLVGGGGMALAYAEVLKNLHVPFDTVCRSKNRAQMFEAKAEVPAISGGLSSYMQSLSELPSHAIVAVGVESLYEIAAELLQKGVKNILVEKPGALFKRQLIELERLRLVNGATVVIGYNRRFYCSVDMLRTMVKSDGGATSIHFEFTEWADMISPLVKGASVKERWILSNSSHVIDLAFSFCGGPKKMNSEVSGELDWHPTGSTFVGSGVLTSGVPFSYCADWSSQGRWGVFVKTREGTYALAPMEELKFLRRNSVIAATVELRDELDTKYKPGVYEQVREFLSPDVDANIGCTLRQHISNYEWFVRIAGYDC